MDTFLIGFIPVGLFLFGTIFYTRITVGLLIVAGVLFTSYLVGVVIKGEFKRWEH